MNERNPILSAIQKMYSYTQEDILRAYGSVNESYDLLIMAIEYCLVNNTNLEQSAQEVLEMRESRCSRIKPKTEKKWKWVMSDADDTPLWITRKHCTEETASEYGKPIQKIDSTMIEVEI